MGVREVVDYCRKHRTVRIAVLYLPMAWATLRAVLITHRALETPDWIPKFVAVVLVIGYPVALIISWAMDIGDREDREAAANASMLELPAGVNRTNSDMKPMSFGLLMVFGLLLLVVGLYVMYEPISAKVSEPSISQKSIAVMPFVNMSTDPDNQFFCDGLSEELLNLLASVETLDVAARTSSFALRDSKSDIPTIGNQLRVGHVVEGSVRRSGEKIRVTAQLIRSRDGYHIWSQNYDRDFTEIFAIQDDIAKKIVDKLVESLSLKSGASALATVGRTDPLTYESYLKGRGALLGGNSADYQRAEALFEHALAASPEYLPARASLLQVRSLMSRSQNLDTSQRESILQRAQAVLEEEPENAAAASALAIQGLRLYRWEETEDALEVALGAHNQDASLILLYADLLLALGETDAARHELSRLSPADADSPKATYLRAFVNYSSPSATALDELFALSQRTQLEPATNTVAQNSGLIAIRQCREALNGDVGYETACADVGDYTAVLLAAEGFGEKALADLLNRVQNKAGDAKLVHLPEFQQLQGKPGYQSLIETMGLPSAGPSGGT